MADMQVYNQEAGVFMKKKEYMTTDATRDVNG